MCFHLCIAYLSEGGKTKVNMMFSCSSSNPVKLTKVAIKVQSFVNSCCSIRMVIEESNLATATEACSYFSWPLSCCYVLCTFSIVRCQKDPLDQKRDWCLLLMISKGKKDLIM